MSQSKRGSFTEACVGTAIGLVISTATQLIVNEAYSLQLNLTHNLQIVGIFTVISVARSYLVRRLFNAYHRHELHANGSLPLPSDDRRGVPGEG